MEFLFSAGGLVYKKDPVLQLLLIKTRNFKGDEMWQLPKGKIEDGENAAQAALREVEEETGAVASIIEKIADVQYFFKHQSTFFKKKVVFFLMQYDKGELVPQEGEVEDVGWFSPQEARSKLSYKNEWQIVDKGLKKISPQAS